MPSERRHTLTSRAAIFAALVSVSAIGPIAQTTPPAAQTIRGRIIADENGQPLANVRVLVRGTSNITRTDLDGRFTLAAPANSVLVVTKAGYVRRQIERALSSEIRLTRSVAIAGRVTNDRGEPVPDVQMAVTTRDSRDMPMQALATTTTDDRGEYRIGGLAPGAYVVSARRSTYSAVVINEPNGAAGFGLAQFLTWFPDAASADLATPIGLAAGDERQDIDVHIAANTTNRDELAVMVRLTTEQSRLSGVKEPIGTAAVSGTIVSSDGRALPLASVTLGEGQRQPLNLQLPR